MIHDPELLDQLTAFEQVGFADTVFRATRKSLHPLAPSTSGGRWAREDSVAVLYTSCTKEGAMAEICYHWSQFSPIPTKPAALHELRVSAQKTLRLIRADLAKLGVDWDRYTEVNYARTQEIGAAVEFLGCDGIIAPCARWECENLVLFMENHQTDDNELEVVRSQEINWREWGEQHGVVGALS